jgi:type I restriction enzyme S subunit
VDERIGQLTRKRALLEDYKKGVMQQLFSQVLRFKDDNGKDFPDWEEKRYDSVYSFKNTNSYSRDLLNYEYGDVRNIHYGDIHTKFKSNFYLKNEIVPFIKPDVELKRISEECYCCVGDLVIADASEDYKDIGKCIEILDLGDERTLAGLHTFIARPKEGKMAHGFGGYLMQSRDIRLKIMIIAQGTKVLGLSKTQLRNVLISYPSLPEQTKIADLLSAIDNKIDNVATQITETQTFKRGLLQQMFV